jgi:hypothetical protein
MVYNTRTFSLFRCFKEYSVSETGSVSILRSSDRTERNQEGACSLEEWMKEKFQKPSNPGIFVSAQCYV